PTVTMDSTVDPTMDVPSSSKQDSTTPREKAGAMSPGMCRFCGGGPTIWENDMTCLIMIIVFTILFPPWGLLGFCCIEKRPRCMRCGAGGGM
ncbi:hypothetical protein PFISCL1PPCAC_7158, partial [Pristionchus fissidentatus]